MKMIPLGYEVDTGKPVSVPLLNLAVTGQTQESGKTTTLEALATRSGARVLTFVTKRGEGAFVGARRVQPYFRDRADWQFVMGLIETMMKEKNRFLRQYVIPICRTTKTLKDVKREVGKKKGAIYVEIDAYLDLILPEIERARLAPALDLRPGLNVMDLVDASLPMQMLFVQSAIDWINEWERDTVVIIPEAWEFIPEGKSSPVKPSAEALVRKGSGIGNHIWVDSQDMAGVDKMILRGCPVWIVGVQKEANEVKRNLANIPAPAGKLKPVDIQNLDRGQFYVAYGKTLSKVYVRPSWMPEAEAVEVARGTSHVLSRPPKKSDALREQGRTLAKEIEKQPFFTRQAAKEEPTVKESEAAALRAENERLQATVDALKQDIRRLTMNAPPAPSSAKANKPAPEPKGATVLAGGGVDMDAIYAEVKRRAANDPSILAILSEKAELTVTVQRKVVQATQESLRGKVAILISEDFFASVTSANTAYNELIRRGASVAKPSVYKECDILTSMGFLTKESGGYQVVEGMKINIVQG